MPSRLGGALDQWADAPAAGGVAAEAPVGAPVVGDSFAPVFISGLEVGLVVIPLPCAPAVVGIAALPDVTAEPLPAFCAIAGAAAIEKLATAAAAKASVAKRDGVFDMGPPKECVRGG